jgi:hypothetical protein
MKRLTLIALSVLLLSSVVLLPSCKRQSDEEAYAIACDLLERSYNLNVAYYGEGLAYDEDELVEGSYYHVSMDAPFTRRSDLINETKAVFSERIASDLVDVYIDGTASLGVVLYARYITGYDGYLTVRKDYDNILDEVEKYDASTLEIKKNNRREIRATVQNVDKTAEIEVVLVYEANGWRVDSPTY